MKTEPELAATRYTLSQGADRATTAQDGLELLERAHRDLRRVETDSKLKRTDIELMDTLLDLTEFQFRLAAMRDTGDMCADLTRIRHRLCAVSFSLGEIEGAI